MHPTNPGDEPLLDDLGGLPAGSFGPPAAPEVRRAILDRTSAEIRWRARRRRFLTPLCALLAFGLGFSAAWAFRDAVVGPAVPPHRIGQAEGIDPGPPRLALDPAAILEKVPAVPLAERPGLLKQAGDSYLAMQGNMEKALDCYRQFLEIAPEDVAGRPAPGDPWLLEALKLARHTPRRR